MRLLLLLLAAPAFAQDDALVFGRLAEMAGQLGSPVAARPRLSMDPADPSAKLWEEGFDEMYTQLRSNLRSRNGQRYAIPGPRFPGVYLWDSAFIAEVWRLWDPQVGQELILSVIRGQRPDGRIPHVRSIVGTSEYANPPLLAWSALRLFQATKDADFLRAAYPALARNAAWLEANRRLPSGLYFWAHPYESGIDNAPRFADRAERRFDDTTKLAAVDLSAYMVIDAESLAGIADALGLSGEASEHRAKANQIRALIDARLWNERRGAYLDRRESGEFVDVLTVASLVPLAAGVPSPERAARILAQIRDPRAFNTPIPFPSVARSDPAFEKDMWRGPVWINMAYLALIGLKRYGYDDDAAAMGGRLAHGVYRTWNETGRFLEFYDPERTDVAELTRKKGNLYKRITLGGKPVSRYVGWTALVNNVVVEILGERVER